MNNNIFFALISDGIRRMRGEDDNKLNSSLQRCSTATDPTTIDGAVKKEMSVQQSFKNPASNLANTTAEDGTKPENMVSFNNSFVCSCTFHFSCPLTCLISFYRR